MGFSSSSIPLIVPITPTPLEGIVILSLSNIFVDYSIIESRSIS